MNFSPDDLPLIGLVPFEEAVELSQKGNPTIYPWVEWPHNGEETCAIAQHYSPEFLVKNWYPHLVKNNPSIFIDWYMLEKRKKVLSTMLKTFIDSHSSFELSDLAKVFSLCTWYETDHMWSVTAMISVYGMDFVDASDPFPGPRGETVRSLSARISSLTETLVSSLRKKGLSYQEILDQFPTRPRLNGLVNSTSSLEDILELFEVLFPRGVGFPEDPHARRILQTELPAKIDNVIRSGPRDSKYDFPLFYKEFAPVFLKDPGLKSAFQFGIQDVSLGTVRSLESIPYLTDEIPMKLGRFILVQDVPDEIMEKVISNPDCWNGVARLSDGLAVSREMQLKIMRNPELSSKLILHSRESLSLVAEIIMDRVPEFPAHEFMSSKLRTYFANTDYLRHLDAPSQRIKKDLLAFLNSSPESVNFFSKNHPVFLKRILDGVQNPERIWDSKKFYQLLQSTKWITVTSLLSNSPLFALDAVNKNTFATFRGSIVAEAVKQYAATGDAFATKILSHVSQSRHTLEQLMVVQNPPLLGGSVESHVQEINRLAAGSSVSKFAALLAASYHYQGYAHLRLLAYCDNYDFVSKFHLTLKEHASSRTGDFWQELYVSLHWHREDLPKEASKFALLNNFFPDYANWTEPKLQGALTAILTMYLEPTQAVYAYHMAKEWPGTLRELIESVIAANS